MLCPACDHPDSKVVDSRTAGDAIRRRRECLSCQHRFTTHERVDRRPPMIVKKDGRREPFQAEKVLHGLKLACRKRPVDAAQLDELVRTVEDRLASLRTSEVPSDEVGRAVLDALRVVDPVAYIRFASVYQAFEDVEQFIDVIRPLTARAAEDPA